MYNDAVLQKWALEGKAQWETYNVATFDAATINVPKNGFLLLRQIIYNHFCDYPAPGTQKAVLDCTVHQLTVVQKGDNNGLSYTLRSPVTLVQDADNNWHPQITAGPEIIETWKMFRESVCIDLIRVPAMSTLAKTDGKFLPEAEERQTPQGFGNTFAGVDIVGLVTLPGVEGKYFPNGDKRVIAGTNPAAAGAGYRDQFRVNINATNRLNHAPGSANAAAQNKAPFITFGFWIVTGSPAEIAKQY